MTNDFSIKQAMETAVSQAESFDQSDYAAGDLVPIFRPNATTGRDELVGKIPKSYFMQAAVASMKDLLRGTNLGANIDKVPTLNANNFGSTSIADLASVLGETKISVNSSSDLNTLTALNTAYVWGSSIPANAPAGCYYSCCYNFVTSATSAIGTYRGQVCFERGNGRAFVRRCEDGNWISWKEIAMDIPSFYKNYATLQNLISAAFTTIGNVSDANDAPIGICTLTSNGSHLPVPAQLLCLTLGGYSQRVQLAFRFINGEVYTRVCNDTVWGSWYKIGVTIVQ